MKLTLAIIIAALLSLFFIITTIPPYDIFEYFSRIFLIITILGLLLSLCFLPWLQGSFSDKWSIAMKYGLLLTFTAFDLGYMVFSLSTLI